MVSLSFTLEHFAVSRGGVDLPSPTFAITELVPVVATGLLCRGMITDAMNFKELHDGVNNARTSPPPSLSLPLLSQFDTGVSVIQEPLLSSAIHPVMH